MGLEGAVPFSSSPMTPSPPDHRRELIYLLPFISSTPGPRSPPPGIPLIPIYLSSTPSSLWLRIWVGWGESWCRSYSPVPGAHNGENEEHDRQEGCGTVIPWYASLPPCLCPKISMSPFVPKFDAYEMIISTHTCYVLEHHMPYHYSDINS